MGSLRYTVCQEVENQTVPKTKTVGEADVRSLVEKAADGDIEAFGELYGIYLDRIYRYVFYQVRDKATAEDLAEEVFLKAWEGISKFKWKGPPFQAWLYRIARNHIIDYFRTKRQQVPLDEELTADDKEPEQEADDKQTQRMLSKAIFSLPEQQRQIIILKFVEGMENCEIAQVLRKSEGAIRITQMRALTALRRKLDKEMGNAN
ncbi:MAG TPA: sigma-70 family RNA polymerase sigma factor [Dehalococcoidia bacterium]|nr:sigma-70 family RNA polymerase sigma factor [Dehalococcoidia bacterium]